MTYEEWAEEYFGKGVEPPAACRDAWNAGQEQLEHHYARWICEGEDLFEKPASWSLAFNVGAWWADRPWRGKQ